MAHSRFFWERWPLWNLQGVLTLQFIEESHRPGKGALSRTHCRVIKCVYQFNFGEYSILGFRCNNCFLKLFRFSKIRWCIFKPSKHVTVLSKTVFFFFKASMNIHVQSTFKTILLVAQDLVSEMLSTKKSMLLRNIGKDGNRL